MPEQLFKPLQTAIKKVLQDGMMLTRIQKVGAGDSCSVDYDLMVELQDQYDLFFDNDEWENHIAPTCKYCNGDCPNDHNNACDGFLGDIDELYKENC